MTRDEQVAQFKHLTECVLPERAREQHWPLRLDHCFKRVCLDFAFGDVWYRHLRKPAQKYLEGEPLARALRCALDLAGGDARLLESRNQQSLVWRGKRVW